MVAQKAIWNDRNGRGKKHTGETDGKDRKRAMLWAQNGVRGGLWWSKREGRATFPRLDLRKIREKENHVAGFTDDVTIVKE